MSAVILIHPGKYGHCLLLKDEGNVSRHDDKGNGPEKSGGNWSTCNLVPFSENANTDLSQEKE